MIGLRGQRAEGRGQVASKLYSLVLVCAFMCTFLFANILPTKVNAEKFLGTPYNHELLSETNFDDIEVGDTVKFGKYIGADVANVKDWRNYSLDATLNPVTTLGDISWIVVEKDASTVTLYALYCIDSLTYHYTYTDVTWETSSIRAWLNGGSNASNYADGTLETNMPLHLIDGYPLTIYESATWESASSDGFLNTTNFTPGEISAIVPQTNGGETNSYRPTVPQGNAVSSKVWLPSLDQILTWGTANTGALYKAHLNNSSLFDDLSPNNYYGTFGTQFSMSPYRINHTNAYMGCIYLRTMGGSAKSVSFVYGYSRGSFASYMGYLDATTNSASVKTSGSTSPYEIRPALVVDVSGLSKEYSIYDFNCDYTVDTLDINMIKGKYKSEESSDILLFDFDEDGEISTVDIIIVKANWGDY